LDDDVEGCCGVVLIGWMDGWISYKVDWDGWMGLWKKNFFSLFLFSLLVFWFFWRKKKQQN